MNELIENYQSYLDNELGFTKETVKKYVDNLNIMFTRMNIKKVDQVNSIVLNKRLLDDFWKSMQENRNLSDSTRKNYLSALKSFIKYLYGRGILEEDISGKIKMPKREILFLEGLNKEEQERLLEYITSNLKSERDLRNTALIMFMWSTGCRITEALELNCHGDSYIYTQNPKIYSGSFHVDKSEDKSRVYVHINGKAHKNRVIRVSDRAIMYLNLYLSDRKIKDNVLFHNMWNNFSKDTRLKRSAAYGIITKIFEKCEIKKTKGLCTHTFRHTAINHWIEEGHSDQEISAMGGLLPGSIVVYRNRNKYLTDVFGEVSDAIPKTKNDMINKNEELLMKRYFSM